MPEKNPLRLSQVPWIFMADQLRRVGRDDLGRVCQHARADPDYRRSALHYIHIEADDLLTVFHEHFFNREVEMKFGPEAGKKRLSLTLDRQWRLFAILLMAPTLIWTDE